MYFTREPIIQTIISAREGYTICVRSLATEEDIAVEVVELVTFDNLGFYRFTEKGNSYLFPIKSYLLVEQRIQGMVLKSSGRKEKEIKIGKGKEEEPSQKEDKKKRKKNKLLRAKETLETKTEIIEDPVANKPGVDSQKSSEEKKEKVSSRFLIPPPEGLISESLHKAAMKRNEPTLAPTPLEESITSEENKS